MNRFDSWPFHCRSVFVAHLENLMPPVKVLKKHSTFFVKNLVIGELMIKFGPDTVVVYINKMKTISDVYQGFNSMNTHEH